jgi:pimeloyl-ACP methyl ester carboxylesterase
MPVMPLPHGNLYYETAGQGSSVALLHGMWSNHRSWRHMVPELSTAHHVVLLDSMGHGQSDRLRIPYRLSTYALDLDFLLNALKTDTIGLVGFSMGALIAQEYYFLFPSKVTSLVLIATPPPYKLRWRLGIGIVSFMEKLGIASLKKECIKALSRRYPKDTTKKVIDEKGLSLYDDDEFALILRSIWKKDGVGRESEIRVPTLIIVGEKDGIRSHSVYLQQTIPHSRLLTVPDCEHSVMSARPEFLTREILRFLNAVHSDAEHAAD